MKKSFLSLLVCAVCILACKNGSNHEGHQHDADGNHIEGTHEHEDGSVHQNHDTVPANQETFDASKDTTKHTH